MKGPTFVVVEFRGVVGCEFADLPQIVGLIDLDLGGLLDLIRPLHETVRVPVVVERYGDGERHTLSGLGVAW